MKKIAIFAAFIGNILLNGSLQLTSPAFKHNGMIPEKYTCDGENISPRLEWTGAPDGTKSFVLLVEDPDAPGKVWVHWLLFNIPETVDHLSENILAGEFTNGATDFHGAQHYGGPCPPSGTHRYNFTLYALNYMPNNYLFSKPDILRAGATKKQVFDTVQDHIIGSTTLVGRYSKKKQN